MYVIIKQLLYISHEIGKLMKNIDIFSYLYGTMYVRVTQSGDK